MLILNTRENFQFMLNSQNLRSTEYVFAQWAIYDTRSTFRRNKADLKSFLSSTSSWGEKRWVHAFLKEISVKWDANSFMKGLNSDHRFHL